MLKPVEHGFQKLPEKTQRAWSQSPLWQIQTCMHFLRSTSFCTVAPDFLLSLISQRWIPSTWIINRFKFEREYYSNLVQEEITLFIHVNTTQYGHKPLKRNLKKEQELLWYSNYCDKWKKEGLKLKEASGTQTVSSASHWPLAAFVIFL